MRILILHNHVPDDASPDERDVLVQRDAVRDALRAGGHDVCSLGCDLNLDELRSSLIQHAPDVVFNLVESLGGSDRLMSLVPQLLESMDVPFTGSSSTAILATGSKVAAKKRMRAVGLPTPDWIDSCEMQSVVISAHDSYILKPVWEHASAGLDDDSVVAGQNAEEIRRLLRECADGGRRPHFAERYIEGREFNISMLAADLLDDHRAPFHADRPLGSAVQVLPAAEIDFSQFPAGKPRMVGYRAKWEEASFEYQNTPRRFVEDAERELTEKLFHLARACWDCFELRGYARVDFRVDADGQPWILEVNVNPCLAPDAGFMAALERSGLTLTQALTRILQDVPR